MKKPASAFRYIFVTGLFSLLSFAPANVEAREPPSGCPEIPAIINAGAVSLYVKKRLDESGGVCTRIVNGLNETIIFGSGSLWLHKKKGKKYRPIEEPDV
jgi:hypothetical protein